MSYVPKPNTGTLFMNDFKKSPAAPDRRGDLFLDKKFITDLVRDTEGDLVRISLSAWEKSGPKGEYLSMAASVPYVKPDAQAPAKPKAPIEDDEDVPF